MPITWLPPYVPPRKFVAKVTRDLESLPKEVPVEGDLLG